MGGHLETSFAQHRAADRPLPGYVEQEGDHAKSGAESRSSAYPTGFSAHGNTRPDFFFQAPAQFVLRHIQVVIHLQPQPELR